MSHPAPLPASIHEDFTRGTAPKGSSDRSFGVVFAVFFAVLAFWPWIHGGAARLWALGVSCGFLAAAVFFPRLLHDPNKWWMRLALLLGKITNPVIIAIMFAVAFIPVAALRRLMRRDSLRLKPHPDANSYWLPRTPPGPAAETMQNQF